MSLLMPALAGGAPYDVPADANPLHLEFVPELRQTISSGQCTARGGINSSHGAPLAFASCYPPSYLPGTQARIGAPIDRCGRRHGDSRRH
jgi:hypothetical protein